jgi:hypothetical protein
MKGSRSRNTPLNPLSRGEEKKGCRIGTHLLIPSQEGRRKERV